MPVELLHAAWPHVVASYATERYAAQLALPGPPFGPLGRAAWIAPNRHAARDARRRVVAAAGGAVWQPGVQTLDSLAAGVLRQGPPRRLSSSVARALAGSLIQRGLQAGRIEPLRPLADTPALAGWVVRRCRELRAKGVRPQAAASYLEPEEGEAGVALAWVYRAYAAELDRLELMDEAAIAAAATATLQDLPREQHARLVVVHLGADTVTETAAPLLQVIARAAAEVLVIIPQTGIRPTPDALELSLARLTKLFGQPVTSKDLGTGSPDKAAVPALAPVVHRFHAEEGRADTIPPHAAEPAELLRAKDALEVLAARNEQEETRRVVGRVKGWLQSTPDLLGDLSEVVIAIPTAAYAERLRGELLAAGVPAWLSTGPPLRRSAWTRLALELLRLDANDWAYDDVLQLLRRGDLHQLGPVSALRDAEKLIRRRAAPTGRVHLAVEADDQAAKPGLAPLALLTEVLDGLPTTATPCAWLAALEKATQRLGAKAAHHQGETARFEQSVRDALLRGAAEIETLARWGGTPPPSWRRSDFLAWLEVTAETQRLPPAPERQACVRVVSYAEAATLCVRRLVVVGLSEQALAGNATGDNPLGIDPAGLGLKELLARPTEAVLLSYAALDDKGQTLRPSPWVDDLEQLFPPGVLRRDHNLLGVVDADAGPVTARGWRLLATQDALAEGPAGRSDRRMLASLARHGGTAAEAAIAGLKIVRARAQGDTLGPVEGRLLTAEPLLSTRFGPDHLWSATQLERYAACPFQFFAHDVLEAEPADELRLATDPRRRGSRLHELLAKLHAAIEDGAATPEIFRAELDRLIAEVAHSGGLPEHQRALAAIERLQLAKWLEAYPDQSAKYLDRWRDLDEPLMPAMFEARFGPPRNQTDEPQDHDPHSKDTPLELELPGVGTVLVRGSIDRIDRGKTGGTTVFSVIDYKSSREMSVKEEHVRRGTQLQPILYALAAQQVLLSDSHTEPIAIAAGYWVIRKEKKQQVIWEPIAGLADLNQPLKANQAWKPKPSEAWEQAVQMVHERIAAIVQNVRSGDFGVRPADKKTCEYCDYRTACRVAQARAVGKLPDVEETDPRSHGSAS
ncbi:PD-(D/E)XK nuclease family protein [Botrimarina hoheduenensis]|uniref:ATP-dependent helicase/deoxyribonuclease subunit B n=1 Tax=Botrimarina hoheduenensis TaxID=2528000 RepID=A0A5C5WER4_9BACT|nr:PD-(D/E)XK nuclease family protein [Botrimarina hoheduenensis]TWT48545.1 ATP-dependent helicase/deoxyribonuclease subunit B [Botrimarina hoheduenensis]